MLPRSLSCRALVLATVLALATVGLTAPVHARPAKDPRATRALFVDPSMSAVQQGGVYRQRIGSKAQALWVTPYYPTSSVRAAVRGYTRRAAAARRTPTLVVYGIPGRDCGGASSGGLADAAAYRAWVAQIAAGLRGQRAIVVVEPDAVPLFAGPVSACPTRPPGWQRMLRYATRTLSRSGAWVYLDAGHSHWTPYANRAAALKRSGIAYARGFSTNVSNFRSTAAEKRYAAVLLRDLRRLGVRGKRYVVDASRNGARPGTGVLNPTWARVGRAPRLVLRGAFDGTLWVKHPGESDGQVNGGPPAGQWCDLLADRLLGRSGSGTC
jgi:endoglucanase